MDKLKLIKTIVVILTFMLIFGTLLLLGSIIKKTQTTTAPIPEQILLKQPAGSRIAQILPHNENLYILIKDGGLSDRIIIINSPNGKINSTIILNED